MLAVFQVLVSASRAAASLPVLGTAPLALAPLGLGRGRLRLPLLLLGKRLQLARGGAAPLAALAAAAPVAVVVAITILLRRFRLARLLWLLLRHHDLVSGCAALAQDAVDGARAYPPSSSSAAASAVIPPLLPVPFSLVVTKGDGGPLGVVGAISHRFRALSS